MRWFGTIYKDHRNNAAQLPPREAGALLHEFYDLNELYEFYPFDIFSVMITDPRLFWLRLARLPGVGPVLVKRLLEYFHSPEAILTAHPAALSAVEGVGTLRANQIVAAAVATQKAAEEELAKIDADQITLLTPDHSDFPPGLKNIPDPPILLYVRGQILPSDALALGIVGARQCSLYGREQAHRFAAQLAQAGLTIVSGGARGIDTAAHNGALQVKGRTLVIQGCGLRHTYPPENKALYQRIVGENAGAIISELPLDAPPAAENFPPRNRIIAALSLGILVVEANLRSGSLITARLAAADYGREVFAIPGSITSSASAGTHHLIKSATAHLVDSPEDILQNLGEAGAALIAEKPETEPASTPPNLFATESAAPLPQSKIKNQKSKIIFTSTQQKILGVLDSADAAGGGGLTLDELLERTSLPTPVIIAELTLLQIHSAIIRLPANRFAKVN
ncbi:MAG: DNA-processing protein DprA [Phycisphaerales bacterium]|nr:DNA-processing protein DprA [Phycisphaerales bacterium]